MLFAAANLGRLSTALDRTWIGGNVDWVDGGATGNWSPADEPDADDTAIFNTGDAVNLDSNNAVIGLTLSNGIDLSTNDFDLTVDGLVQLVDSGTNLIVGGADSLLSADSITINNLADLEFTGGTAQVNEESGNGLLDINAGGELLGFGTVSMTDAVAANTTLIVNDGTITAQRAAAAIFGPPVVGTLTIGATDADARIDLDGAGETGDVIVRRNQTLNINLPLADIFNGSVTMNQDTTLDVSSSWILGAGATIDIDNGFVDAAFPIPDTPAGKATIAGSSFAQNSGTISVLDADGTLQFDAPFSMNGGSLVNNGLIVFNNSATIAALASFTMPTASSSIRVEANRTVNIDAPNFNMDGSNAATSVITVEENALLDIVTTDYDPDAATNDYDGTIHLNNGDISVTTSDAEFVMDGVLNMHSDLEGEITVWNGEPLDIGNDAGALDADLNVSGSRQSQIAAAIDFNSDADVDVASGATLAFLSTVNFDTVNGGNNAQFTGTGTIAFSASANVNEAVTLNMVGGTVDLDGLDNVGDFVNIDAPLVINAATMSNFGRANGGGGTNTLDINNSVGTGVLTVNLDDPDGEWTLNGPGVMNLVNDNTEATLLAGSDVNINGTVNVTGDVRTTARLDIAGIVNINTAGQQLRLGGGNSGSDVNTISGATVNGVGQLGADTGKALHGHGTINADVAFVGTANLRAAGGTLTLGGDIVDVNILGTADGTGTLNVVNAWETDGGAGGNIGAVVLAGGVLQGGVITNDNATGLQGHGTITARVINSSKIVATNGGTLVVQTAGNDNDWDGATNAGELQASADTTLELRDVGAAFGFTGKARVFAGGRVYANGFALDFNPGSTLHLTSGVYEATSSTDIGGTVTVDSGSDSTIKVQNNVFLTFETGSSTALAGNLKLLNNNINIEAGAAFSSTGGAITILDGSHLVADNNADIDVLLNMEGAFRPGNFNGIGRVEILDYQQFDTGELYVELIGNALNQYDRLVVGGDVIVDGYLNIDIDEVSPGVPFVPALGQTFNIITAGAVTGTFDFYDVSGMPAGLAFHVNYLNNAVQLEVVNKTIYAADFDDDGDVDLTDYAIWKNAFNLNQLGDANGDNISDASDFTIWRDQLGSVSGGAGAGSLFAASQMAVPEPSLCAFLLGAAGVLLQLRGRKGQ